MSADDAQPPVEELATGFAVLCSPGGTNRFLTDVYSDYESAVSALIARGSLYPKVAKAYVVQVTALAPPDASGLTPCKVECVLPLKMTKGEWERDLKGYIFDDFTTAVRIEDWPEPAS